MSELGTGLPCPEWCWLVRGHAFGSVSPETGALVRFHERAFGPFVIVSMEETAITDDGPVWSTSPPLLLCDTGWMEPEEVEQLRSDLAAAGTLCRRLSASPEQPVLW